MKYYLFFVEDLGNSLEQSGQPTLALQDETDRSVQYNGNHNLKSPTEGRSVPNHYSVQDMPRSNIPRDAPPQTLVTSYTNINDQNIPGNPPTQPPPTVYSQKQYFSPAASSHHLNCKETKDQSLQSPQFCNQSRNRNTHCYGNDLINKNEISNKPLNELNTGEYHDNHPGRTRQPELLQGTTNSEIPGSDYDQRSSMSQETMDQNKYISTNRNHRQQGHSNSMNAKYQLQLVQSSPQIHQPQLTTVDKSQSNYDRDGPRNEKSKYKFVNRYKVRPEADKSPVKSSLTETSVRATRPKTVLSQRHQNERSYSCGDRNTSYVPKEKTENKQRSQSFKLHNPWDFSNKEQDRDRKYRSAEKRLHVEILLARNPRPTV